MPAKLGFDDSSIALLFRAARNRILQSFLDRPRIYLTDAFSERFERQARENVQREIAGLLL